MVMPRGGNTSSSSSPPSSPSLSSSLESTIPRAARIAALAALVAAARSKFCSKLSLKTLLYSSSASAVVTCSSSLTFSSTKAAPQPLSPTGLGSPPRMPWPLAGVMAGKKGSLTPEAPTPPSCSSPSSSSTPSLAMGRTPMASNPHPWGWVSAWPGAT